MTPTNCATPNRSWARRSEPMFFARTYRLGPLSWGYQLSSAFFLPPVVQFQVCVRFGFCAIALIVTRELR